MTRISALLAIIAFAVMSTGMARAEPLATPLSVSAMANHADGQPSPCDQAPQMTCSGCCIIMLASAVAVPDRVTGVARFAVADFLAQLGRVVPPALPPPRG